MERDKRFWADHGNNVLAVLRAPPPAGKLRALPAFGGLRGEAVACSPKPAVAGEPLSALASRRRGGTIPSEYRIKG